MLRTYVRRLMSPGSASPKGVFAIGLVLMLVVFTLDMATDTSIRLHMLYIFPLSLVSIHCVDRRVLALAFLLTLVFQSVALLRLELPGAALCTELLVALASSGLTIALSRGLRSHLLETARLASRDVLTGVRNRRGIDESIGMEIARQKRYGGLFSLAVIDLDNFKQLNDAQGRQRGDKALRVLTAVLSEQTRQSDSVGRLGGDQFAIVMPNMSAEDCDSLCQKLIDDIAHRMMQAGFPLTASIGFASFSVAPSSSEEALLKADKAMYKAKSRGKNCVVGAVGS